MAFDYPTKEKIQCEHCSSLTVRFIDFGRVTERLNERQIAVSETWICKKCGKRFEHVGVLFSPELQPPQAEIKRSQQTK